MPGLRGARGIRLPTARGARAAARRGSRTPRRSAARAPAAGPRGSARAAHARAVEQPARRAPPSGAGQVGADQPRRARSGCAARRPSPLAQEHVDHRRVAHAPPVVADLAADDRRDARVVERVGREADLASARRNAIRACTRPMPTSSTGWCTVPQCALAPATGAALDASCYSCAARMPDPVAQRVARVPVEPPVDHLRR